MMRWYPDREPDPRPIHGWDPRMDPSVKADVVFQDQDDPEGAQAWLDSQLSVISRGMEPPEEPPALMRSVPFPPENVRPPTTEWVPDVSGIPDDMSGDQRVRDRLASLPDGSITIRTRESQPRYPGVPWPMTNEIIESPDFSSDGRESA